jgi:hypothetical protein
MRSVIINMIILSGRKCRERVEGMRWEEEKGISRKGKRKRGQVRC